MKKTLFLILLPLMVVLVIGGIVWSIKSGEKQPANIPLGARTHASGDFENQDITTTGSVDFGGGSFELPNGTTIPGTCNVGQLFHDTDSDDCADTGSGDGILCICKSSDTWAVIQNF